MEFRAIMKHALKWLLVASLLGFGFAMAQTEPTLHQVYATAQAGKLDQAQLMIQQVLIAHPNSAKAFFVQSELYARQGDIGRARESLATAEKLAPGLPFAKAESVQTLRAQLAAPKSREPLSGSTAHSVVPTTAAAAAPMTPASSPAAWALPLLLAAGVIALGYFLFRKKNPGFTPQPGYVNQGGLSGPQTFGSAVGTASYGPQGSMGGAPVSQPYGQPAGSGLGGRIMGGVATGLAVGAGVMAAEAIGRNLMGSHNTPAAEPNNGANNDYQALDRNPDMGGQDFGINDASSWDSGSGDIGGSSDWDN